MSSLTQVKIGGGVSKGLNQAPSLGIHPAFIVGMSIHVGTILEMTGEGYEILVDEETRSYVLARFLDGNFLGNLTASQSSENQGSNEATCLN